MDLRTTEPHMSDVWVEDDEVLHPYRCLECEIAGWAATRKDVETEIVCRECGAKQVVCNV